MPAHLAGTIFGGMFSSRLNMNLREEHGWSYGAFGGFTDAQFQQFVDDNFARAIELRSVWGLTTPENFLALESQDLKACYLPNQREISDRTEELRKINRDYIQAWEG